MLIFVPSPSSLLGSQVGINGCLLDKQIKLQRKLQFYNKASLKKCIQLLPNPFDGNQDLRNWSSSLLAFLYDLLYGRSRILLTSPAVSRRAPCSNQLQIMFLMALLLMTTLKIRNAYVSKKYFISSAPDSLHLTKKKKKRCFSLCRFLRE